MYKTDCYKKCLTEDEIADRAKIANDFLHHYIYRIDNLWKRSVHLQEIFPDSRDENFLKYINTEAILFFRELQDCGIRFPAWEDMLTVGGETDLRIFLQIGRGCYESIMALQQNLWVASGSGRLPSV